MRLADKITASRLVMAFLFFIFYYLPRFAQWAGWEADFRWTVPVLWLVFMWAFISDELDGKIARARNECSDFGSFFDAFVDASWRLSLCFYFASERILFFSLSLLFIMYDCLYHFTIELGLIKNRSNPTESRRFVNTWYYSYQTALAIGLLSLSLSRFGVAVGVQGWLNIASNAVLVISTVFGCLRSYTLFHYTPPPAE